MLDVSVVEDESLDKGSGSGLLFVWLPTVVSVFGGSGRLGFWCFVGRCVGAFLVFLLVLVFFFNACTTSSTLGFSALVQSFVVRMLLSACVRFLMNPSTASWSFTYFISISTSRFSNISRLSVIRWFIVVN